MIKMYFRLNPECFFIRGEKLGAIFDLINEEIYALNQEETEIVTSCEKNNSVSDQNGLLAELKRLRIGNFYPSKVYVQKLRVGSSHQDLQLGNPPELLRVFIEINNSCNRECWFCGSHGVKRSLGCMGCNKWKNNEDPLTIEKWKEVMRALIDLGCRDLFVTGGDLTLAWDKTMDLLNYADGKFQNIYLVLHQLSLTERVMNDVANKAKLIIQSEKSDNSSHGDYVSLVTVNPQNQNWEDISSTTGKNTMIDFVIEDEISSANILPMMSKRKMSANIYQFLNNIKYHPCLGHALSISYNGDVLPCRMMREHSFGNVKYEEIYNILGNKEKEIKNFWQFTLDKIEGCSSCEFRYACTDCRSLEEHLTGRLDGKRTCSYNPREGKWLMRGNESKNQSAA